MRAHECEKFFASVNTGVVSDQIPRQLPAIMNGVIVIVAYRPKPGKDQELLELVRNRVPTLRKEELVTDRVPTIMRARDRTILEVSEWKSPSAINAAHQNPRVLEM
jgi:quinol monooxygenase YgiN